MENRRLALYTCWIDGKEKKGDRFYQLVNPSTGEEFARAAVADEHLVDSAVKSAQQCFADWRQTSASRRADLLHAWADLIRSKQAAIAALVSEEVGKPLPLAGDEVLSSAQLIDYFAEEGLRLVGQVPLLGHHREKVLVVREPVGVVAAITPFNYPLSTLACKVGPALAAGCTVVAKPDEHTPMSSLTLARLAVEAGLPPGAFNVITGPGEEVGRLLVDHPGPRLVTFTGSTEVGKEIQSRCARWVRKVVLELGGHCPAIVCSDAPWRQLLSQIVLQSFKNSGQYCYRISRLCVAEEIYEDFLRQFVGEASRLRVGPSTDPDTDLGPLCHEGILTRVVQQVERARQEGAQVELGGAPLKASRGFYYPPTVLTRVRPEMEILHEEVFGPVVVISSFKQVQDAVREANGTPFGLAAYLFTRDLANALEWAGHLEAGSVWINKIHQAYPQVPFGGMKESGLGREKSRFGLEEYTELKAIYLSY